MERKGIIAAGNMLVDHVHQIVQWPERGWLAEITHSERSTGGAPLNVLLTLAKMRRPAAAGGGADWRRQRRGLHSGNARPVSRQSAARTAHHLCANLHVAGDDRPQRTAHLFPLSRGQPPAGSLAKMHVGLPLQAVGLIGEDSDGDYILAMLDQYHVNRQRVQRTTFAPTSMSQVMTDPSGQRTFSTLPGPTACWISPRLTVSTAQ